MFNIDKQLEDLINQWTPMLDKGLKTQKGLLEIALVPFDAIFEKDAKGNPIYKHLDKSQTKDLIGALQDVINMYEENNHTEGLKKTDKIMKILEKNLEK